MVSEQSLGAQKPRRRLLKFVGAFLVIIILGYAGLLGVAAYREREGVKKVEDLAEALRKDQEAAYQARLADTYGGATPQETLQLYIAAVEKGDFDLASKYLITDEQNGEINDLNSLKAKNNLPRFLRILKNAQPNTQIIDESFSMKSKTIEGPYYFVTFVLYPNGVWKISEI